MRASTNTIVGDVYYVDGETLADVGLNAAEIKRVTTPAGILPAAPAGSEDG